MEGSIGIALRDARLQKKITIEEAARATKIRADRLTDLERDDYAHFPSLAYARGFLLLYAKFLGVDMSKYPTVDVGSPAVIGDYQYLQSERGVSSLRYTRPQARAARKPRWFLALLIFLAALLFGGGVGFLFFLKFQQLPSLDQLLMRQESGKQASPSPSAPANAVSLPEETPVLSTPLPLPKEDQEMLDAAAALEGAAAPVIPAQGEEAQPVAPSPTEGEGAGLAPVDEGAAASATPDATPTATPTATATPVATSVPEAVHEFKVRAGKRTKVKIFLDDANLPPVYDGWLSPGKTLVYRGKRVWIHSTNRETLKITSDGTPITGTAP